MQKRKRYCNDNLLFVYHFAQGNSSTGRDKPTSHGMKKLTLGDIIPLFFYITINPPATLQTLSSCRRVNTTDTPHTHRNDPKGGCRPLLAPHQGQPSHRATTQQGSNSRGPLKSHHCASLGDKIKHRANSGH